MENFRQPSHNVVGRVVWELKRPLLCLDVDVFTMHSSKEIREYIVTHLLDPIRYHRDQRGDDRCWFDDLWLYWHLPESVRYPLKLSTAQMAGYCAYFSACRRGDKAPHTRSDLYQSTDFNKYLEEMTLWQLRSEIRRLRAGIRRHRDIGMNFRWKSDDEDLYTLLPDGIEADFRLPPEHLFLPNCANICGKVEPGNVDLHTWPNDERSPLADWRP